MRTYFVRFANLTLLFGGLLAAQTSDDTILKQVIIFGRHAVRTPNSTNAALLNFSVQQFPVFTDASGAPITSTSVITPNGATDETLLGGYFRLWLTQEGILTGNDAADANFVYLRAEDAPLITDTAQAFAAGLLPAATVTLNAYTPPANDPLFAPVAAGVAMLDYDMALAAVNGRLGGNASSLTSAYSAELALTRSVLFNYPVSQTPPPSTPAGKMDVTAAPITVTTGNSTLPVSLGGLAEVAEAIDPFLMEYTNGLPMVEVGWGQLDADSIGQIYRTYDLLLNLEYKTTYLARVQSSNLASHIVRSLVQAATGNATPGALATPSTKVIALIAANTNIVGLAGLFHLDWLLPSYQPDDAALSGAIVFELRQSQSTGEYIVRTSYVGQTMDQLRNQTVLTLAAPPASAPVFFPGCSIGNATFDCPLGKFVQAANQLIDPHSADLVN